MCNSSIWESSAAVDAVADYPVGELAREAIGDGADAMAGLDIGVRLVEDQGIGVRRADAGE